MPLLIFWLTNCQSIENLEPADTDTFIKFLGGESISSFPEFMDLEIDESGNIHVLWNSDSVAQITQFDRSGNITNNTTIDNVYGSDLMLTGSGFVLLGTMDSLIVGIDETKTTLFKFGADRYFISRGINEDASNYYVNALSSATPISEGITDPLTDVFTINKSDTSLISSAAGTISNIGNDLLIIEDQLYWSGYEVSGIEGDQEIAIFNSDINPKDPKATSFVNQKPSSNPKATTILTQFSEGEFSIAGIGTNDDQGLMILYRYFPSSNRTISTTVNITSQTLLGFEQFRGLSLDQFGQELVIAGSALNTNNGRTDRDLIIAKTDLGGNVIDNLQVTHGGLGDEINGKVKVYPNGGIIFAGTTQVDDSETQIVIMRLNDKGELNFN